MAMAKKLFDAAALAILLALPATPASSEKAGQVTANGLSFAYVEEGVVLEFACSREAEALLVERVAMLEAGAGRSRP